MLSKKNEVLKNSYTTSSQSSNIKNIGCSKVPLNYSLLYDRRLNKANKEVNNVIKVKKNKLYSNEPQAAEGTFSYYANLTD